MTHTPPRQDREFAGLTVGLAGRHGLYITSLARLLASRGADVVMLAPGEAPDESSRRVHVVITEVPLPSEVRRLSAARLPVIVLTDRTGPRDTLALAQQGATAVVAKNAPLGDLRLAVRSVLAATHPARKPRARLTPRQRQVLELLAEGLDNAEIGSRLGITRRTARQHVSTLLARLGAANRTQAAVTAIREGWLDPD